MKCHVVLLVLAFSSGIHMHCIAQATEGMGKEHVRYWQEHKGELRLGKNAVEVPPEELPQKIQKTLDGNDLYKGWRYAPVYFDRKANLYTLYVKKDSTITAYGFNDQGRGVTYDSYTVREE